jgi:hypothetical protein
VEAWCLSAGLLSFVPRGPKNSGALFGLHDQITKFIVKLRFPYVITLTSIYAKPRFLIIVRACFDGFRRSSLLFDSLDDMPEALASIRLSDDKIEIVNQLLLPHATEWLAIDTIEQAHDAIKTMKVGISHRDHRIYATSRG